MTYERRIDPPRSEAIAVSAALRADEADSLRATIDHGMTAARDLFDQGAGAAREVFNKVPARAWRIGAMLTAAAASLAVGTYAALSRSGTTRKRKTTTTRRSGRARKAA